MKVCFNGCMRVPWVRADTRGSVEGLWAICPTHWLSSYACVRNEYACTSRRHCRTSVGGSRCAPTSASRRMHSHRSYCLCRG